MLKEQNNDRNSIAHKKCNFEYHIVFVHKYRRKVKMQAMLTFTCIN